MKAQNIFCGKPTVGFCTMDPPTWGTMAATTRTHGRHKSCNMQSIAIALCTPCGHDPSPASPQAIGLGFVGGVVPTMHIFCVFVIVPIFWDVAIIVTFWFGLAKELARPRVAHSRGVMVPFRRSVGRRDGPSRWTNGSGST